MARQQFIDQIYYLTKKEFINKGFTFNDVWKKIVKDGKLSKEEQNQNIGIVYTDLLQDARFIYMGNKKWMLREFATQEEIDKFQNMLYDFNNDIAEENAAINKTSVTEEPTEIEEDEEIDININRNVGKTYDEKEDE
ncbi:MAG: DNA-directed RNA polymerase subunit delta [Mycoplasmataceae bacterium]|nr:DNA-directed RNA polymerase subunit delta [Mycoplasmataceae bacterium]